MHRREPGLVARCPHTLRAPEPLQSRPGCDASASPLRTDIPSRARPILTRPAFAPQKLPHGRSGSEADEYRSCLLRTNLGLRDNLVTRLSKRLPCSGAIFVLAPWRLVVRGPPPIEKPKTAATNQTLF